MLELPSPRWIGRGIVQPTTSSSDPGRMAQRRHFHGRARSCPQTRHSRQLMKEAGVGNMGKHYPPAARRRQSRTRERKLLYSFDACCRNRRPSACVCAGLVSRPARYSARSYKGRGALNASWLMSPSQETRVLLYKVVQPPMGNKRCRCPRTCTR